MSKTTAQLWPDSATILERSRGVFFAQWEELLRLRRIVMKSAAVDDIHDLRVASRRFRAALELFGPVASKAPKTVLMKSIRQLTRSLGGLRNIDEALLFFQSRNNDALPTDSALFRKLSRLRPREFERIHKTLKAFSHRDLDRMVRKMIEGMHGECDSDQNRFSLLGFFSDASIRHYLPIHQLLPVATVPEQSESRHALRIAIKKWRYFFEIMAQVMDRDYTALLELLREYQSLLGCMNDMAEFRMLLDTCKLPQEEREQASAILLTEDAILLENFKKLVEQKPLSYTFLI
jgi:CHAD domain-containing protein